MNTEIIKGENYNESIVFSKRDLYIRFEEFESGENNILLITGFSGSGKSTLAFYLADKYKADVIQLDWFGWFLSEKVTLEDIKENSPCVYDYYEKNTDTWNNLTKEWTTENEYKLIYDFIPFAFEWCKKQPKKKFIIEGLQVYEFFFMNNKQIPDCPMIIKGTSCVKCVYRALKRGDLKIKDVWKHFRWTIRDNKLLDIFIKSLYDYYNENVESFEDGEVIMESYDVIKVSNKDIIPMFFVTTFTYTRFGKVVRGLTNSTYSHSAIGFKSDLSELYSFNAGFGGLSKESIDGYIGDSEDAEIYVGMVLLTNDEYKIAVNKINDYIRNEDKTSYSFKNLFNIVVNHPSSNKNQFSMICSQFVDSIFKSIDMDLSGKDSSITMPQDLRDSSYKKVFFIYEGLARNYDKNRVQRIILNIKKNSKENNIYKIIQLHKMLNTFRYGIIGANGKFIENPTPEDFSMQYRYMSPKTFLNTKGGVCWDYAEYQYRELLKQGFKVKNYYIELLNKPTYDTHTITVVENDDSYLYLESSFYSIRGVYLARNLGSIFQFVLNAMMEKHPGETYGYFIVEYEGYNRYGCNCVQYMEYMCNKPSIKEGKIRYIPHKDKYENYSLIKVAESTEDSISIFEEKVIISKGIKNIVFDFGSVLVENISGELQMFAYTEDMLKLLKEKGYKLYYISNWDKKSFEKNRDKGIFDFRKHFEGGIVSYEVGIEKPNRSIYELLLEKYNLVAEECIFFDDKKENIDAANKVGMHGYVFNQQIVSDILNMKAYKENSYDELLERELEFCKTDGEIEKVEKKLKSLPKDTIEKLLQKNTGSIVNMTNEEINELVKESASDLNQKCFDDFSQYVNQRRNDGSLFSNIKPLDGPMIHTTKKGEKFLLLGTMSGSDSNKKSILKHLSEDVKYNGESIEFHGCYLPGDIFAYVVIPNTITESVENITVEFSNDDKIFLNSLSEDNLFTESVDTKRDKVLNITLKTLKSKGVNPNVDTKSKAGWLTKNDSGDFGPSLCITNLGTEGLNQLCSDVNLLIKSLGGKLHPDNYGTAFLTVKESGEDDLYEESYVGNYFRNKVLLKRFGKKPELNRKDAIEAIGFLEKSFKKMEKMASVKEVRQKENVDQYFYPVSSLNFPDGMKITFVFCFDDKEFTPGAACYTEEMGYVVIIYPNYFKENMESKLFILLHEVGHIRLHHVDWYNQPWDPKRRTKVMKRGKVIYPEANADLYAVLNGSKMYTILQAGVPEDYDEEYDYRFTNSEMAQRYAKVMKNYGKIKGFGRPVEESGQDQPYTESWIFSQENLELNLDKWVPGNILWITGTSGDGKSTLAHKMLEGKKGFIISTDVLLLRISKSKEKYEKILDRYKNGIALGSSMGVKISLEYIQNHPELPYNLGYSQDPNTESIEGKIFQDFFQYLMIKVSKDYKLSDQYVIVEGCDISFMDPSILVTQPLIILGCSRLRAFIQRYKRERTTDGTGVLQTILKLIRKYKEYGKDLDDKKEKLWRDINNLIGESVVETPFDFVLESNSSNKKQYTIEKEYGVNGPDGAYNACVKVKGIPKPLRGRSEVLIIREDQVFIKFKDNDKYDLPGGSWEENEGHKTAAVREAMEESRIECKNVEYLDTYVEVFDEPKSWVKDKFDKKDWWYGYFTEVYVGEYDKKYTGHIDDVDKDEGMLKKGKFYPIKSIYHKLKDVHQEALASYIKIKEKNIALESVEEQETFSPIGIDEWSIFEYFMEDVAGNTYIIRDEIYPTIAEVLSTPAGDKIYRKAIEDFVDRNTEKLHEVCPTSMIAFTDSDKAKFFDIFGLDQKQTVKIIERALDAISGNAQFRLVKQNPIFTVFYCALRYYTLKNDLTGVNSTLIIHALSSYPSIFSKYFQYGANASIMQYTADHLTEKFIFKQEGHVFGALRKSIESGYNFLKPFIKDGSDKEVVRFIQRVRNDQNSIMKKIKNEYNKNRAAGKYTTTQMDTFDNGALVDDFSNDTSQVETISQKVIINILTNGIDLKILETASSISQLSVVELRYYLTKIMVDSKSTELEQFINAVLFIYLFDEKHKKEEIRSKIFIAYGIDLFRRTNSNNKNVVMIKELLNKWAEETGIHTKFRREATRISYKKGIFWYIVLSIQAMA